MSPHDSKTISTAYVNEKKKLLGYIRKRVPASVEPEDILQDVFYQLSVGFRDFDRIRNITAWLYRVTDNRITDLFRRRKPVNMPVTYSAGSFDDEPLTLEEILPALGTAPEDKEIKELIWEVIEETLDELPEEQRYAFTANEFDDLSFREMSQITGVTVNTLISRKRYAVLALREKLRELYKLLKNE
jgi:RNA polymerase sigma factor (sigma-70 family)